MDADREDKCVVVLIAPSEHVLPGALHRIRVNVAVLSPVSISPRISNFNRSTYRVCSRTVPLKWRPVIQCPVRRYLYDITLLCVLHRHHPLIGVLRVIRSHHLFLPGTDVVRLKVVMHKGVIVFKPQLAHQFDLIRVVLPRRRGETKRRLTAKVCCDLDCLYKNGF
jgi:hypothetical protein